MSDKRPARIFTSWGTVIYSDPATRLLRHGPVATSPENVFLLPREGRGEGARTFSLTYVDGSHKNALCDSAPIHIVKLERGIVGLRSGKAFLSAESDGSVTLTKSWCSTWEFFLLSEDWCLEAADDDRRSPSHVERRLLRSFIVDPKLRALARKNTKAKKLLIHGYTQWSHGRVYYDLCKHLSERGYIVDILDWRADHAAYVREILPFYDLYMTALDGVRPLVDSYGAPYEKIIALSHHEFDMRMLIEQKGLDVFGKFANFGVVSESLYSASQMLGISRAPQVAPLGVNYSEFHAEIPRRLVTVGYASSMSATTYGIEWKRGELARAAAKEAGLEFKVAGSTGKQISIHDMPDFYRSVDAVVNSSLSESGPLTVLEGAAAGRLVICTPVGHFPRRAYEGAGVLAPIEAHKFKTFTAETLKHYRENPLEFVDKCKSIQDAARLADWQYLIDDWMNLIELRTEDITPARPRPRKTVREKRLINLDRYPERQAVFRERNSHLQCIERVSAIDGLTLDRGALVREGIITPDCTYQAGSLGCALSHSNLWKSAVNRNEVTTILEDDVVCCENFDEESARIESLLPADWDVILWSYCFDPLFVWIDIGVAKVKLQTYDRRFSDSPGAFRKERINSAPVRVAHAFGLMSYSVSPKGASQLLEKCFPLTSRFFPFPGTGIVIEDTGIDCPMCAAYPHMSVYACIPPLAIHDDTQRSSRREAGG